MTLAIQRQPRFTKALVVVGSMAAAAGLVVGMARSGSPDVTGSANVARTAHVASGHSFESVQDDYLVPAAILARQAANEAELRLQNGYLAPAVRVGSTQQAWLNVQDGYLPPTGNPVIDSSEEPTTSVRFGPR